MTFFMIGVIVMTFFFPLFNTRKKNEPVFRQEITRSSSESSKESNKKSSPGFVNLIEEEIEYALETEKELVINPSSFITISFSLPNLFFKEHFSEVSGPPPWA